MPAKADTEGYINYLAMCVERLSSCHQTLVDVKADLGHPLVRPAFRYAIVEYITLFSQSKDTHEPPRYIPVACVPTKHEVLHQKLKADRHQLHAHADMSVLERSLTFTDKRGLPITTTTFSHVDDLAELSNIDEFLDLIQGVRDNLFAERAKLLEALPSHQP